MQFTNRKKTSLSKIVLAALCASFLQTHAETFIYNMVLDRASLAPFFYGNTDHDLTFSATGFGQFRGNSESAHANSHFCKGSGTAAGMFKLYFFSDPVWAGVKVITGERFDRNHNSNDDNDSDCCPNEKHSLVDDILVTAGFTTSWCEGQFVNVYGLAGLPTHKPRAGLVSGSRDEFGFGFYSAGIEADGSFAYYTCNATQHSLLVNARYINFFSRDVRTNIVSNASACRASNCTRIDPGSLVDVLVGNHSAWDCHHLEFGYNPQIGFGTKEFACGPCGHHKERHFVRSTLYGNYFYEWDFDCNSATLGFGGSLGIRHEKPHYLLGTFWINLGINF